MFSQRQLQRLVSRCAEYEFEDVICEIDDVEMITPEPYRLFGVGQKVTNQLARWVSIASVNPGVQKLCLNRNYDLFIMICQFPRDLLSLNAVKGWRRRCRTSVCWLSELWAVELPKYKGHLKLLSNFDYVVLPCCGSIQAVKDVIGDRCVCLPPGIDTIRFCPYPNLPIRSIDVYSMGRKSLITHQALLKMAEKNRFFYIYDTFENMETLLPQDHRILLANIAKRSRYFIVNAPKINRQFETNNQREVSYRFFEGAASGTVMIGETGENEAFKKHFDWPDSVIHAPYNTSDIAEILIDLDSQPERLAEIRKTNVIQSLLRHDWVYRWRAVLDIVGLKPKPALIDREERLKKLAEDVTNRSFS
jgi:hypothetical protein